MAGNALKTPDFTELCTSRCNGICCNPWWGVIFYTLQVRGASLGSGALNKEVAASIRKRQERITRAYVTKEDPPRSLFTTPERYNVVLENITPVAGNGYKLELRAMFAFCCGFLSSENKCQIHPTLNDSGRDIRPPHCAELGTPTARSGDKGYCRIIEAAVLKGDDASIDDASDAGISDAGISDAGRGEAIALERSTSEKHFSEGVTTIEEAAEGVVRRVEDYMKANTNRIEASPARTRPGRNDPCPCGSGKKFKQCHGN